MKPPMNADDRRSKQPRRLLPQKSQIKFNKNNVLYRLSALYGLELLIFFGVPLKGVLKRIYRPLSAADIFDFVTGSK